ncbi:hypothetical protein ABPG74_001034 [Tetrahymena malaccensis]
MEDKIDQLDIQNYKEEIQLCGIRLAKEKANNFIEQHRKFIFEKTHFNKVVNLGKIDGVDLRLILLKQDFQEQDFPEKWPKDLVDDIQKSSFQIVTQKYVLTLDNYSSLEFLTKFLPSEVPIPTGYEIVGHIAHFNLTQEQLPYKKIIGETILHKNKCIKTVVNKLEKLHNVYRTPELEVIAGENNLETIHKEGKFIFHLNFEKVYWCSRLQVERDRVLSFLKPKQTVLDLFCGVGPFSIRAAKMGCYVICNDLNPHSYDYLLINRMKNRVEDKLLCFNNDARKVVDKILNPISVKNYPKNFQHFDHVYMNLPVNNIEFCDVFLGLLRKSDPEIWKTDNLPIIHATGFIKQNSEEDCITEIELRIKKTLPNFRKEQILQFQVIKNVNPHLQMFCISFPLSIEDANSDPSKTYQYIQPEREDESLPLNNE